MNQNSFIATCEQAYRKVIKRFWCFLCLALLGMSAQAQVLYGVGSDLTTPTLADFTSLYTVNPTTGAATKICTMAAPSTANAASSINGLVYYISRATPAVLHTIDPVTCVDNTLPGVLPTALDNIALRMTICPDGRLYAAGSVAPFYELDVTTGATLRSLTWVNVPNAGSGDMACAPNGNMYLIAQTVVGQPYTLFVATAASFQPPVPTGSNVTFSTVGTTIGTGFTGVNPAGLAVGPPGGAGCAAAPAPCLYAVTSTNRNTIAIDSSTGVGTTVGNSISALSDLATAFPVDVSITKSVSPTNALAGQTVVYVLNVTNNGPAASTAIRVTDTLPAGIAASPTATWACAINAAGTPTLVTNSCGTASGTGNVSLTVSLTVGASLKITITATVGNNTSGTMTNLAQATLTMPGISDPVLTNNSTSVTSSVTPVANLQVTKTNNLSSVTAGATVIYTVTFTNNGPSSADNALAGDIPSTGLSNCTILTCTPTGAAVCPAAGTWPNFFTTTKMAIPTFPSGSTVVLRVQCGVTATGQ